MMMTMMMMMMTMMTMMTMIMMTMMTMMMMRMMMMMMMMTMMMMMMMIYDDDDDDDDDDDNSDDQIRNVDRCNSCNLLFSYTNHSDEFLKYFDWIEDEQISESSIFKWVPSEDEDDCAYACLNQTDFQCVAFNFAFDHGNWTCGLACPEYNVTKTESSGFFRIEKMPCK